MKRSMGRFIASVSLIVAIIVICMAGLGRMNSDSLTVEPPLISDSVNSTSKILENYLFEDFEKVDLSTMLPCGWKTSAGEAAGSKSWSVGILTDADGVGRQCVYLRGKDNVGDLWLFSPQVHLSEHILYVDFKVLAPGDEKEKVKSRIEIYLCDLPCPSRVVTRCNPVEIGHDRWSQAMRQFTEGYADGDYFIGFRCTSAADSKIVGIDDVRLFNGCEPNLYGSASSSH